VTRRLVLMLLALVAGCRGEQRPWAMRALIREVVSPGYREAARSSRALTEALAAFQAAPDPTRLAAARRAWQQAAVAWRRLLAYRLGDVGTSGVLSRAGYWPLQPGGIERLLAAPRPPGPELIAEAGVSAKGLFAVEHLLYAPSVASPGADRSRQLALAFARDIEAAAATALHHLDGEAERLAARPHETINKLVEQLFETVDFLTATRLSYPLEATPAQLHNKPVEGHASGTSLPLTLAVLEGVDRLYTVGLERLVPLPAVAVRARAALDRARDAIGAIAMPIEDAARARPSAVGEAAAATRALEKVLKVELAGALGVTATFSSGDGD
jgi:uncharacterized protein